MGDNMTQDIVQKGCTRILLHMPYCRKMKLSKLLLDKMSRFWRQGEQEVVDLLGQI